MANVCEMISGMVSCINVDFSNLRLSLGLVTTRYCIEMDLEKIQDIMDLSIPTSIPEVHSFMGLAGYYH